MTVLLQNNDTDPSTGVEQPCYPGTLPVFPREINKDATKQ